MTACPATVADSNIVQLELTYSNKIRSVGPLGDIVEIGWIMRKDQPDLKATFQFTVKAPEGWTVISNSPTPEPKDNVWAFEPTPRISSYITALIVGPYHSVHSVYEKDGQSAEAVQLGHPARALD